MVSNNFLSINVEADIGKFRLAINFAVDGGIVVLFGLSGGGKSSTLNCIAGLITPKSGWIKFGDNTFFDSTAGVNLRPQFRKVGYVFQNSCLFPHLNVVDNIAFALAPSAASGRRARVDELVDLFQLRGLESAKPNQLSGGQVQRVALARALAPNPRILLLDEPFGALDDDLRLQLSSELVQLQRNLDLTVVLVTHSKAEAASLGTYLVQINAGVVLAAGAPEAILNK